LITIVKTTPTTKDGEGKTNTDHQQDAFAKKLQSQVANVKQEYDAEAARGVL
jgi:hypothetical protein